MADQWISILQVEGCFQLGNFLDTEDMEDADTNLWARLKEELEEDESGFYCAPQTDMLRPWQEQII